MAPETYGAETYGSETNGAETNGSGDLVQWFIVQVQFWLVEIAIQLKLWADWICQPSVDIWLASEHLTAIGGDQRGFSILIGQLNWSLIG